MLGRLDDWLISRWFTPLAQWIEGRSDHGPIAVSREALNMGVVVMLGDTAYRYFVENDQTTPTSWWMWALLGFATVIIGLIYWDQIKLLRVATKWPRGMAALIFKTPTFMFQRSFMLGYSAGVIITYLIQTLLGQFKVSMVFGAVSLALLLISFYIRATDPPPPTRREEEESEDATDLVPQL